MGIGNPFAPLRIGPDGLVPERCGMMLNVAPVSTKKLSLVSSSFKNIKPAFVRNDIAVAGHMDLAGHRAGKARRLFQFPEWLQGLTHLKALAS
jgi:hypothetical protein